ncbi:MAG: hypothetical protein ACREOH_11835, partial [Candidatus Entotheonellia bacterium]
MASYDPQQHRPLAFHFGQDPQAAAESLLALVLWMLGYPDQARGVSQAALAHSRDLPHSNTLAYTRFFGGAMLAAFLHEAEALEEHGEALKVLSEEQGLALWWALARTVESWTIAIRGHWEEGIACIAEGLAALRATGSDFLRPFWLSLLAEAYRVGGQTAEGLRVVDEALGLTETAGERLLEAELCRLKGELLLREDVGDETRAEGQLQQALAIARAQQAKSLELRAAISLSRLWQRQG